MPRGVKKQPDATRVAHLKTAVELTAGDRNSTYGDPWTNHANIASLWSAYLSNALNVDVNLDATDAAQMMALLKIARTQEGEHNVDNYIDGACYVAIAGECADFDRVE